MAFESLYMIFLFLILPLILAALQFFIKFKTKLEWVIYSFIIILFTCFIYIAAFWALVGYYLRYAIMIIVLLSVLYTYFKKISKLPFNSKNKKRLVFVGIGVIFSLICLFLCIHALDGYSYPAEVPSIDLIFPLKNGSYYVAQGGSNAQLNMHTSYLQKYAYDIIKLNSLGLRASSLDLFSLNLDDYYIFRKKVFSPCDGKILEAYNNAPDMVLGQMNKIDYNGNYVLIQCKEAKVLMAHFLKESLLVKENDLVKTGQELGRIGNSGNTSEPHLHINAIDDKGNPVIIKFGQNTFARNSIIEEK